MRQYFRVLVVMAGGLFSVACSAQNVEQTPPDPVLPDEEPAPDPVIAFASGGYFLPLLGYEGSEATGSVLVIRNLDGTSSVSLSASGLVPNTAYPSHLHDQPCAYQAGGHYKIDPTVVDPIQDNEVWPAFTTDENGHGEAWIPSPHLVRGDALSVVIHDPNAANAKMLCADLKTTDPTPTLQSGLIGPFAGAEALDQTISGTAELRRYADRTEVEVDLTGLTPGETYVSHVHQYPCEVNDAGGHYKRDPTGDGVEENELWPNISPDGSGAATDLLTVPHSTRSDAQSVVIHRAIGGQNPKVACADLVREEYQPLTLQGSLQLFPEAEARGFNELNGSATITRGFEGQTEATLIVSGLEPRTEYATHVHNRPCSIESGGAHYEIDPEIVDVIEENELWLNFTTNALGNGSPTVTVSGHTARADAQAVVIHDTDGARLGCVDLR